jgi:arylsulfatase A-like enzyme
MLFKPYTALQASFLMLCCLAQPSARAAIAEEAQPPNIVLIFVDDLGYGDLGAYGQQLILTPNLDQMAADGLRFTDFYSGDTWCPAARNSLMAGLHNGHTQLRGAGVLDEDTAVLPLYLSRFLHNAGYATGMFGKWGLGSYAPPADVGAAATGGRPSELGFDEFLGQMTHRDAHTHSLPPYPQQSGDSRIHPKLWTVSGGVTVEESTLDVPYIEDATIAAALDFIDRHSGEPFFLYLPWSLPHAEYFLPADDDAWTPYLDGNDQSIFPETPWPGNSGFRRPVEAPRAAFAAAVTRLDRDAGSILARLQQLEIAENTVVLFASDNGPAADGGFESPEFFNSSGGLRGAKLSLYEGGIRVPLIAQWSGTVSPGGVTDLPLALWDILPTVLEIAGVSQPPGLDGLSMLPILLGDEVSQPTHDQLRPLYWETFNWIYRGQATRLNDWKAVRPALVDSWDPVELYDLANDAAETNDVAAVPANCTLLLQLKALLNSARIPPPLDPASFAIPTLHLHCPVFSDDFESGTLAGWRQAGPGVVEATSGAAFEGNFGLQATLGSASCAGPHHRDLVPPPMTLTGEFEACVSVAVSGRQVVTPGATLRAGETIALGEGLSVASDVVFEAEIDSGLSPFAWVEDVSPAAETGYSARFFLRLDDLALADGDRLDLFNGYSRAGIPEFLLTLRRDGVLERNLLELTARRNDGGLTVTPPGDEIVLPNGWIEIEVEWTAGYGDGHLWVSIDGGGFGGLSALENFDSRVDSVRWGAIAGAIESSSGRMQMDDFRSGRE